MLENVKDISIKVIEYKDVIFWGKTLGEYTLDKVHFRTNFKCPDKHCMDIDIRQVITDMISQDETFSEFSKPCEGNDELGRRCIAGIKFIVSIEYFDQRMVRGDS
jgi:hypothetical protein